MLVLLFTLPRRLKEFSVDVTRISYKYLQCGMNQGPLRVIIIPFKDLYQL